MPKQPEVCLEGSALSKGIAIGMPFILDTLDIQIPEISLSEDEIDDEIKRYRAALSATQQDLAQLKSSLEMEGILEGAQVIDAHVQLTRDPLLNAEIEASIQQESKNAEFILTSIMSRYGKKFRKISDPFFQQRFEIVQDIYKRVLEHLAKSKRDFLSEIPHESIVFAQSISPSSAAEANHEKVCAFVTQFGGAMSHMAIVAKARGIPYVANVDFTKIVKFRSDSLVIVDGLLGRIILNPTKKTLNQYQKLKSHIHHKYEQLKVVSSDASYTKDGLRVRLSANVEMSDDFSTLKKNGAEGVGLFRSEYLVLGRGSFPTEDEQYAVYKNLVDSMQGAPVVIRAFDIGMDKVVSGLGLIKEQNPALGARAIRFLLREKEIFTLQIRAILRAAVGGDVRILFPMVSSVTELREAKEVVYRAYDALIKERKAVPESIKLGSMVEVPSAAMIADLIARECDFLSIGTNDLIQYALAIDRTQHTANALFTSTHPGVIRLVKIIIERAQKENVPICVCGEIASDPRFVPLLIGLGICELSVASRFLPLIKHVVRHTSKMEAELLAQEVLSLKTATEIQSLLIARYERDIPQDAHTHF